jgi:hypothetical protein
MTIGDNAGYAGASSSVRVMPQNGTGQGRATIVQLKKIRRILMRKSQAIALLPFVSIILLGGGLRWKTNCST